MNTPNPTQAPDMAVEAAKDWLRRLCADHMYPQLKPLLPFLADSALTRPQEVAAPVAIETETSALGWPMSGLAGNMSKLRERWADMKTLGYKGAGEREVDRYWGPLAATTIARYFEEIDNALAASRAPVAVGVEPMDGAQNPKFTMAEWSAHARKHRWRFDIETPQDATPSPGAGGSVGAEPGKDAKND